VLRKSGVNVCIGGFHVSGVIAMLPEIPPELKEAMDLGISLFAVRRKALRDGSARRRAGALKPLYNFMDDLPALEGTTLPMLPVSRVERTGGSLTSFDAGRGCPFQCSFCTIINVQGASRAIVRRMRSRPLSGVTSRRASSAFSSRR